MFAPCLVYGTEKGFGLTTNNAILAYRGDRNNKGLREMLDESKVQHMFCQT